MAGPSDEVRAWGKELRKGTSRLTILALLKKGESYGYEILTRLRSLSSVGHGASEATVYPLLHDLATGGYLQADWRETTAGTPPRKYYRLTDKGRSALQTLVSEWAAAVREINELLGARK